MPDLGEYVLPYEAVRTANDPDAALLNFLQSTYEAGATRGDWNRDALEQPERGPRSSCQSNADQRPPAVSPTRPTTPSRARRVSPA